MFSTWNRPTGHDLEPKIPLRRLRRCSMVLLQPMGVTWPTWRPRSRLRKDMFKWYLWGLDMRIWGFTDLAYYIYITQENWWKIVSRVPNSGVFLDFAFMQSIGTAADRAANGHCLKMVWEAGDPPPLNGKIITVHLLHLEGKSDSSSLLWRDSLKSKAYKKWPPLLP